MFSLVPRSQGMERRRWSGRLPTARNIAVLSVPTTRSLSSPSTRPGTSLTRPALERGAEQLARRWILEDDRHREKRQTMAEVDRRLADLKSLEQVQVQDPFGHTYRPDMTNKQAGCVPPALFRST